MASTALARLANSRGGTSKGTRLGSPDWIFRKTTKTTTTMPSGRKFIPPRDATGSRDYGGVFRLTNSGYQSYGLNQGVRNPFPKSKSFKTVTNVIPKKTKFQQFARSADLTASANIAPILNKIANFYGDKAKGRARLNNTKVIGIYAGTAVFTGVSLMYVRSQMPSGKRAKKKKIAAKNKKAALKAKKIEARKTLRASKSIKPMKGATGRGVAKGKVGQSGGGRKNFRPRRDGNGKFAGSY